MGCDIHWFVEVKKNGSWEFAGKNQWNMQWHDWNEEPPFICSARNYRLFALLANVRNYQGVDPFDDPRGVPGDASKEYMQEIEYYGVNAHSASYFTLSELLRHDWEGAVKEGGFITLNQYRELKNDGKFPMLWSGEVWGGNLVKIEEEEVTDGMESTRQREIYVNASWERPGALSWFKEHLDEMEKLGDADDVRAVFFFDN